TNRDLSRRKGGFPVGIQVAENRQGAPTSSRTGLRRPHLRRDGPQSARANKFAALVWPRSTERYWLSLDSAGRPGHQALGLHQLRQESRLLRWREYREA